MKTYLSLLLLLVYLPMAVHGKVSAKDKAIDNKNLFGLRFAEDKEEYFGRVGSINSISIQSYYTAAFEVREFVIEMQSSALQLRVYSTQVINPGSAYDQASSKVDLGSLPSPNIPSMPTPFTKAGDAVSDAMNAVVYKEYPITTHSKTIEYRVASHDDVESLYSEFRKRWAKVSSDGENAAEDYTKQLEESNDGDQGGGDAGLDPEGQESTGLQNQLNGVLFTISKQ